MLCELGVRKDLLGKLESIPVLLPFVAFDDLLKEGILFRRKSWLLRHPLTWFLDVDQKQQNRDYSCWWWLSPAVFFVAAKKSINDPLNYSGWLLLIGICILPALNPWLNSRCVKKRMSLSSKTSTSMHNRCWSSEGDSILTAIVQSERHSERKSEGKPETYSERHSERKKNVCTILTCILFNQVLLLFHVSINLTHARETVDSDCLTLLGKVRRHQWLEDILFLFTCSSSSFLVVFSHTIISLLHLHFGSREWERRTRNDSCCSTGMTKENDRPFLLFGLFSFNLRHVTVKKAVKYILCNSKSSSLNGSSKSLEEKLSWKGLSKKRSHSLYIRKMAVIFAQKEKSSFLFLWWRWSYVVVLLFVKKMHLWTWDINTKLYLFYKNRGLEIKASVSWCCVLCMSCEREQTDHDKLLLLRESFSLERLRD